MHFAENLKQLQKEHHLSQEELAEILDVSRQAVSKWEQGSGYPEVEKLLLLSRHFRISLDSLLSTEITQAEKTTHTPGTITITSPHENVVVTCNTVLSSRKMSGGKSAPQYALFAVQYSAAPSVFSGPPTTFLGWYADKEHVTQEIAEIQSAILHGFAVYTLKYSAKTERKWLKIKIIDEEKTDL